MTKIDRSLMPQIPQNQLREYIRYLKSEGVACSIEKMPVHKLKPVQKHVNQSKVETLAQDISIIRKPLVVTYEGYIIDGHHRWLALQEQGMRYVPCIVCNTNLRDILKKSHDFEHSYTKSVHEVTTYSRLNTFIRDYLYNNGII